MTLSEKDQLYNWHPYTQHQTTGILPAIVRGKGALLWDEKNKEYVDAIASWWVNPFTIQMNLLHKLFIIS